MDGLIVILILISVISSISKKKKAVQKQTAPQKAAAPKPEQKEERGKIPFTKKEWNEYLANIAQQDINSAAAPDPILLVEHDEPEGTVSSQGETAAEHDQHRQALLAEEARLQEMHKTLQEMRHLNRQKLRNAVVMSEVLGKPVSMRPRGQR